MTQQEAFILGCIATVVVELIALGALWIARSRPLVDAMEGEHGDWPNAGRH